MCSTQRCCRRRNTADTDVRISLAKQRFTASTGTDQRPTNMHKHAYVVAWRCWRYLTRNGAAAAGIGCMVGVAGDGTRIEGRGVGRYLRGARGRHSRRSRFVPQSCARPALSFSHPPCRLASSSDGKMSRNGQKSRNPLKFRIFRVPQRICGEA